MAQEKLQGPVCLNHPDKPAVAHCCVCRRPVCQECLVREDGFLCCSRECLKQARESTSRTADILERRNRGAGGRRLRALARRVVLAALAGACWYFRGDIQGLYNRFFGRGKPTVKQRIQDINRKNLQKDHERRNRKMNEWEQEGL